MLLKLIATVILCLSSLLVVTIIDDDLDSDSKAAIIYMMNKTFIDNVLLSDGAIGDSSND